MKITITHIKSVFCALCLFVFIAVNAQQICDNSKQEITLSNGAKVYLFQEKNNPNSIYFLPTALQLSENNDAPEFSYQEYTNEGSPSPDGAIFHFLITWGLTKQQLEELAIRARECYGETALLAGALYLEAATSGLTINNQTAVGKILNASLKSKGSPPTTSSGKMALSFHVQKENVNVMSDAIKKPAKLSGTVISIDYNYKTYTCTGGIDTVKNNTITLIGNMKQWF